MDPATALALVNLISLSVKTYEQYTTGEITAEQAQALFAAAADNLTNAVAAFNAAKPAP